MSFLSFLPTNAVGAGETFTVQMDSRPGGLSFLSFPSLTLCLGVVVLVPTLAGVGFRLTRLLTKTGLNGRG